MEFKTWIESVNIHQIAKKANIDISKYDLKQLQMGYKVELEHGKHDKETDVTHSDPVKTLKIAIAHLKEKPNYYTLLKKVED